MRRFQGNRTTTDWKEDKHNEIADKKKNKVNRKKASASTDKTTSGKLISNGGISKIVMNPEDEEMLLRLITMLDSGELEINLASALPDIPDSNCESSDDDDDDDNNVGGDDDDDAGDDDDSDSDPEDSSSSDDDNFSQETKEIKAAASHPAKTEMIFTEKQRRSLVRRLIRDDRKTSFDLACKIRDEKVSRTLLARSMMISQKKTLQSDNLNETNSSLLLKNSGLPLYLDESPIVSSSSSVVRVNISCSSKPGNISKVVLVERTETVEGLVEIARKKFTVPKKYSVLLIVPEGTILRPETLFTLPNGSNLSLAIGSDKVQLSNEKAEAAPRSDKVRAVHTALKNDEESEKPGDGDNSTVAVKEDYWSPPDNGNVIQAQKTPRRLGDDAECNLRRSKQESMFASPSYKEIRNQRQSLPISKVRKVKEIFFRCIVCVMYPLLTSRFFISNIFNSSL